MKRKLFAVLLTVSLLATVFSVNTYAAEEYKSVDVSYKIDYGYTLHIPASANMSKGAPLELTASDIIIGETERVVVSLDCITTKLSEDSIVLYNSEGMSCLFNIFTQDSDGENKRQVTNTARTMALFKAGDTKAYSGGTITLSPNITGHVMAGSYSGTLCFVVEVMDEFQLAG